MRVRATGGAAETRELRKAARAFRAAEQKLAAAILLAHEAGASLRAIAKEAEISHEKVRTIVGRERRRIAGNPP